MHIREWRSLLALVWLLAQAAASLAAAASLPPGAASAVRVACTCPIDHADDTCPMHQTGVGGEREDCTVRSALVATDAALLSLATGLGIPSSSAIAIGPPSTHPLDTAMSAATGATDVPDFPPPRG